MNSLLLNSSIIELITPATNGTVQALSAFFGFALYLIILNGFGVLAIACKVTEYQVKNRLTMLTVATLANFLWVLYFVFYGDWASALTCVIATIRLLIFLQKGKKKWADSNFWLILFLALQVIVSFISFTSFKDVFALTAGFVGIIAYYVIDARKYRILSLIFMLLWIVNGILKFYPVALVSDSFSVISVTVAIFRYDIFAPKGKKIEEKVVDDTQTIAENNQ